MYLPAENQSQGKLCRALARVSSGVQFHGGSRVEDFKPLFKLLNQASKRAVDLKADTAVKASGNTVEQANVGRLSDEVLTLYLAVLTGHSQQARSSVHSFLSQVA